MGKMRGQKEYEKFKEDEPLTMKGSIKAMCYMCNGEEDGSNEDCQGTACPLYTYFKRWMRYKRSRGDKGLAVA
jgi:hypothetical protein